MSAAERRRRRRLALVLLLLAGMGLALGLLAGSEGWRLDDLAGQPGGDLILWEIRAPRSLGAWLVGALFGLSGALAQGLFRNPLADPYLLGSAAGASLGVVVVLAAGGLLGSAVSPVGVDLVQRLGLVGAAFVGALAGVSATLLLARGAQHTTRLLLAGVVVGVDSEAVAGDTGGFLRARRAKGERGDGDSRDPCRGEPGVGAAEGG